MIAQSHHDHHAAHADHHGAAGHDKHAGHDPEMFRRRFWLSLALTIPLVVTSEMVMEWFNYARRPAADGRGTGRCSARSCSGGAAGRSSPAASPRSATASRG